MKIATYNVNGVNGRLPVLIRWLDEAQPDIVCLQELKSPNEKFPEKAISFVIEPFLKSKRKRTPFSSWITARIFSFQ